MKKTAPPENNVVLFAENIFNKGLAYWFEKFGQKFIVHKMAFLFYYFLAIQ